MSDEEVRYSDTCSVHGIEDQSKYMYSVGLRLTNESLPSSRLYTERPVRCNVVET